MAEEKVDRGDELTEEQLAAPEPEEDVKEPEKKAEKAEKAEKTEEAEKTEKAEKTDRPDNWVPSFRMRAVSAAKAKAEAENAELKKKLAELEKKTAEVSKESPEPKARDFDAEVEAAELELAAAMKDNDPDAVLAANRKIRVIERARSEEQIAQARNEGVSARDALVQREFDEALGIIEEEFPQLVPDGDRFDQRKFDMVQRLLSSYEAEGAPSDQALIWAVGMVFPEDETPTKKPKESADRGLKAKLEAAQNTPPDVNSGGQDSDSAGMTDNIQLSKLTEEEFAALPAATLKRLRGDMATH